MVWELDYTSFLDDSLASKCPALGNSTNLQVKAACVGLLVATCVAFMMAQKCPLALHMPSNVACFCAR